MYEKEVGEVEDEGTGWGVVRCTQKQPTRPWHSREKDNKKEGSKGGRKRMLPHLSYAPISSLIVHPLPSPLPPVSSISKGDPTLQFAGNHP